MSNRPKDGTSTPLSPATNGHTRMINSTSSTATATPGDLLVSWSLPPLPGVNPNNGSSFTGGVLPPLPPADQPRDANPIHITNNNTKNFDQHSRMMLNHRGSSDFEVDDGRTPLQQVGTFGHSPAANNDAVGTGTVVGTTAPAGIGLHSDLLRHVPTTVAVATATALSYAAAAADNNRSTTTATTTTARKRPRSETDRRISKPVVDASWSPPNTTTLTTTSSGTAVQQQDLALIRIVTKMLRDQADLCGQQASQLEHISRNILHDKQEAWFQTTTDRGDGIHGSFQQQQQQQQQRNEHQDCRQEIKELKRQMQEYTLEREAVIKLCTNCYQGMKQLQKTMDAFLRLPTQMQQQQQPCQIFATEKNSNPRQNFHSNVESIEHHDDLHVENEKNHCSDQESSIVMDPSQQKQQKEEKLEKTSDSEESQEEYESSILGSFLNDPQLKPIQVVKSRGKISERSDDDDDSFSSNSDDG